MSFSSTPLGQGRRLDHHTFLNKPPSANTNLPSSNQPPRPSSPLPGRTRPIPASYAYGAPTLGTRSPPKPTPSSAPPDDDSEQPALVRFARQKQKELGQTRSAPDLGPHSLTTQPRPEKWSVKDTSVQIASAFHQAATSSSLDDSIPHSTVPPPPSNTMSNPNDAWASGANRKSTVTRSTSVEYEKETHSTVNRRLGAPPNRLVSSRAPKPLSKTTSLRHVPDSEGEGEEDGNEGAGTNTNGIRATSPVYQAFKRLVPTTFFMRAGDEDHDNNGFHNHNNSKDTDGTANMSTTVSYDYSTEEREYQASTQQQLSATQKSSSATATARRTASSNTVHRRNRISMDNKAYRPTVSEEDSDEEFEENGKKSRRKKAKKGSAPGGPLTTLPVAGYDKRRKKRKSGAKGNGVEENGEEESSDGQEEDEQSKVSEQRSVRGMTPIQRALSARSSIPPPSRMSVPRGSVPPELDSAAVPETSGTDIENALSPIQEDEEYLETDFDGEHSADRSFSVGAVLGRGVNWTVKTSFRIIASLLLFFTSILATFVRVIKSIVTLVFLSPARWISNFSSAPFSQLGKYGVIAFSLYISWFLLRSGYLTIIVDKSPAPAGVPYTTVYQPPAVPPVDISELSVRLQRMESALAALSVSSERSRTYIEGDAKHQAEISGRIGALESQVQRGTSKTQDLEGKLSSATKQGINAVKHDMDVLRAQIQAQQGRQQQHASGPHMDEEARSKLRALEERVGSMEGGVREAIELGKNAVAVGAGAFAGGSIGAWWNKFSSGKEAGITIKSTDGQDITTLIQHLVARANSVASMDSLARPDYALYSGGASVIPSLTSQTFRVVPDTFAGRLFDMGTVDGRPPVTALHHELHIGYCWPFVGTQGQLGVMLAAPVVISDVTIDHVPREVATDPRSAPRHMVLWGLVEGAENIAKYEKYQEEKKAIRDQEVVFIDGVEHGGTKDDYPETLPRSPPYMKIAEFVYNIHSPQYIQTFPVLEEVRVLGMDFGVVVLRVESNWGKEESTCLYRLRIHGEQLGGVPVPLSEEYATLPSSEQS